MERTINGKTYTFSPLKKIEAYIEKSVAQKPSWEGEEDKHFTVFLDASCVLEDFDEIEKLLLSKKFNVMIAEDDYNEILLLSNRARSKKIKEMAGKIIAADVPRWFSKREMLRSPIARAESEERHVFLFYEPLRAKNFVMQMRRLKVKNYRYLLFDSQHARDYADSHPDSLATVKKAENLPGENEPVDIRSSFSPYRETASTEPDMDFGRGETATLVKAYFYDANNGDVPKAVKEKGEPRDGKECFFRKRYEQDGFEGDDYLRVNYEELSIGDRAGRFDVKVSELNPTGLGGGEAQIFEMQTDASEPVYLKLYRDRVLCRDEFENKLNDMSEVGKTGKSFAAFPQKLVYATAERCTGLDANGDGCFQSREPVCVGFTMKRIPVGDKVFGKPKNSEEREEMLLDFLALYLELSLLQFFVVDISGKNFIYSKENELLAVDADSIQLVNYPGGGNVNAYRHPETFGMELVGLRDLHHLYFSVAVMVWNILCKFENDTTPLLQPWDSEDEEDDDIQWGDKYVFPFSTLGPIGIRTRGTHARREYLMKWRRLSPRQRDLFATAFSAPKKSEKSGKRGLVLKNEANDTGVGRCDRVPSIGEWIDTLKWRKNFNK